MASLLQIDDMVFLLDCGAHSDLNPSVALAILPHAQRIDAVLLSSPELTSCGSLPLVAPMLRPDCLILATTPTIKLGQANVMSQYLSRYGVPDAAEVTRLREAATTGRASAAVAPSRHNDEGCQTYDAAFGKKEGAVRLFSPIKAGGAGVPILSPVAILAAFHRPQEVHYDQRVTVQAAAAVVAHEQQNTRLTHIDVRALRSGRVLGGASWRLSSVVDDIVYLTDGSLKPTVAVPPMLPPRGCNVLIAQCVAATVPDVELAKALQTVTPALSSGDAVNQPLPAGDSGASARTLTASVTNDAVNAALYRQVKICFRRDGTTLICTNIFTHGISVLLALAKLVEQDGLSCPIVVACPKAHDLVERLRTSSEYLVEGSLALEDGNTTTLPRVVRAHTLEEVRAVAGAKCIVAHSDDLNDGIAADLLPDILEDASSAIILTDQPAPGSVAARLLMEAGVPQRTGLKQPSSFSYPQLSRTVLQGDELLQYQEDMAALTDDALLASSGGGDGLEDDGAMLAPEAAVAGDEESEEEEEEETANALPTMTPSLTGAVLPSPIMTPGLFLPSTLATFQSRHLMFPAFVHALAAQDSDAEAAAARDVATYGMPLDERLRRRYLRLAEAAPVANDELPVAYAGHRGQVAPLDTAPARVRRRMVHVDAVNCSLLFLNYSGRMDQPSFYHLLRSCFRDMRKVALLRAPKSDLTALVTFCGAEGVCREAIHVSTPSSGQVAFLETPVTALEAKLDPRLLLAVQQELRKVGTLSAGSAMAGDGHDGNEGAAVLWEVGWLRAALVGLQANESDLSAQHGGDLVDDAEGVGYVSAGTTALGKRPRESDPRQQQPHRTVRPLATLTPLDGVNALSVAHRGGATGDAAVGRSDASIGSHFIGSLQLPTLNRALKESLKSTSSSSHSAAAVHTQEGLPVTLANNAVAVRRRRGDGHVLVEGVPSHDLFTVRSTVYAQYGTVL